MEENLDFVRSCRIFKESNLPGLIDFLPPGKGTSLVISIV